MQFEANDFSKQLPYYLTEAEKTGLAKALADFPRRISYYINRYGDELLQGDTWAGVPVIDFHSMRMKNVKAIVLSNSCSVSPENSRALPPKVVVSPLVPLDKYVELLRRTGLSDASIAEKCVAIREQRIANIFYLPKGGGLDFDAIAVLDDLHSLPASILDVKNSSVGKLTTLANVGFYLFLFKLSIHFCRFHENVSRIDVMDCAVV